MFNRINRTLSAMVVTLIALSLFVTAVPSAQAAAYITISGVAIKSPQGTRIAGAGMYLYRWNGSSWDNLGKKAISDAYGRYAIGNVPSNYYYFVRGWKVFGDCRIYEGAAIYDGNSPVLTVYGVFCLTPRNGALEFIDDIL